MGKRAARVVTIDIQAGNVIEADDVVRCHPAQKLLFVVTNNDNVDHYVWVDGGEIIQREDHGTMNPPPSNPLDLGKVWVKVRPTETDVIKHSVRKKADFGRTSLLPYTTYKYTINSGVGSQADPHPATLDPDIDVVKP